MGDGQTTSKGYQANRKASAPKEGSKLVSAADQSASVLATAQQVKHSQRKGKPDSTAVVVNNDSEASDIVV